MKTLYQAQTLYLFLSLYHVLSMVKAQDMTPENYFAGIDNEDYLTWVNDVAADYENSIFIPQNSANIASSMEGAALHWTIIDDIIEIGLAVRATGWLGFGLSESGGMRGSDILIFESANPNQVIDTHVLGDRTTPTTDDCASDWELISSTTNSDMFLMVQVRRKLDTGDMQDYPILDHKDRTLPEQRVIAAWGDSTVMSYHQPENTARAALRWNGNTEDFQTKMNENKDGTFELRQVNYPIPAVETEYHYVCLSANDLREQNVPIDTDNGVGIIGFEPVVSSMHLHHYLVYASFDENNNDTTCDETYMDLIYVWAPGSPPYATPDKVDFGVGGSSGYHSFQIEIHYNNPELLTDSIDNSGIDFHYTHVRRELEMGILQVGDPFVFLQNETVGSGLTSHSFSCSQECSTLALSNGAVTVDREYLHMHADGVSAYHEHRRDNEVLRVAKAQYFDFDQQGAQVVMQVGGFTIEPGDSFHMNCFYNSPNDETVFGLGSADEMCIAYIMYYPRAPLLYGAFPWMCAYGLDELLSDVEGFPCYATHNTEIPVADDGSLQREFGSDMMECGVEDGDPADSDGGHSVEDSGVIGNSRWMMLVLGTLTMFFFNAVIFD